MSHMTWGPGDVVWEDGLVDARTMKLIEIEVGKAVPGERAEHKPPGFGAPRDNRRRFRAPVGRAGEHGGFAPGERDHEPLQLGSEHDLNEVEMEEVDRNRHRAPGEDGNEPGKAGDHIPPDTNDPQEHSQHVVADAIHDHENGGDIGSGNLPKALTPGMVTRDFPGWRYDRALAIHYGRTLAACGVLVDTEAIADQWLAVHKAEGQTPPGGDPKPWIAAQVSRWSVSLRQMLNELWREGWYLGAESGRAVARTSAPDWGDWSPGNPSAAKIVRTAKDLKRWLNTYGIATIRSIEQNRMGELAKALNLSLKEGWSTETLARYIENVLTNPSRARMIARTETARAVSQGTLAEYRHAEVERVMWVTADDTTVCIPCDANEAMGAIPTGSMFSGTMTDAPPGHPNCRCAVIAVPDGMEVPVRAPAVTKFSPGKVHDKLSDHYPDKVLGWVKEAAWSDPTEIKLKHIDMARRPGGRDMKKVRGMAKAIKAGKKMDPIYLVDTPSAPPMAIADGYHRALAHQHAGKQTIMAHVASVDEEHGPWDRAMHDAKLNKMQLAEVSKVGPKGYIHGWIFVGPQAAGSRVFHSSHGHGEVVDHQSDGEHGHVDVAFDSGHKETYRARFKPSSQPRLYGPVEPDKPKTNPHVDRVGKLNQQHVPPKLGSGSPQWKKLNSAERRKVTKALAKSARGDLKINMSGEHLLKVAREGRMKTLYESHESKGEGYFRHRKEYESRTMDVAGVSDAEMPIYGTVNSGESASAYGEVTVVLKDAVRDRTSVTGGDSLNFELTPQALRHVEREDMDDVEVMNMASEDNIYAAANFGKHSWQHADSDDPDMSPWGDYLEAQIHGGVSLDDIAEVRIPPHNPYSQMADWEQADLVHALKLRGVKVIEGYDPDFGVKGHA